MRITSTLAVALALGLVAPPVAADDDRDRGAAQQRSGDRSGSSASSSSDAGSRHHAAPSSAQPRSGGSSTPSVSSGAAARHPRAGTGSGGYRGSGRGSHGYYGGYYGYYSPYYSYYYDAPWAWGFYPYGFGWYGDWGWGGYYWSRPYYRTGYYSRSGYRAGGELRVLVKPAKARVYVDGHYAGVVDDFDGLFQRLRVPAGRHEIAFKLEGYRTHRVKVYLERDETLKLRHEMVKGEGETEEDRVPAEAALREREEREEQERVRPRRRAAEVEERAPAATAAPAPASEGTRVVLDVEPADASVYVNGEFRGTVGELRQVALPPGKHRIEIVRPGYVTLDREIEVGAEAVPLTAKLEKR